MKLNTLKKKLAFAEKIKGCEISSLEGDNFQLVDRVCISSSGECPIDPGYMYQYELDYLDTNPDVVVYILIKDSETDNGVIITDNAEEELQIDNIIEVNGYTGEDMGECYEFGCANISKDQLRSAKEYLQLVNDPDDDEDEFSNRKIEGVKIGEGIFTLGILNKMNL